jgi:ABC-type transporter Mla subunit MlaD
METQKEDLGVFVDSARAAAATFATRSAELRETLRRAPRGLATLERFLAQLRVTAGPLGPAARTLTGTAPALTSTLAALPAFRREARPTLLAAVQAAPLLTQLADGATPVIDRSLPTLASLNGFATTAVPATATLGRSIDDLLGVLEGWGRATSARDGLSHVFHGRVVVGPDAVRQLVNSVKPTRRAAARRKRRPATPPAITAPASRPPAPRPTGPAAPPLATKPLLGQVEGLVQGLVGALPRVQTPLLDYLLKP